MAEHVLDYNRYLKSSEWRMRRRHILATQTACQLCGSRERLEVHHRNYDHLGAEPDDDLLVLCAVCHRRDDEPLWRLRRYDARFDGWLRKRLGRWPTDDEREANRDAFHRFLDEKDGHPW